MFDFEQLRVYQKSLELNKEVFGFLKEHPSIDRFLQDQLKRASVSITANLAEGSGRLTVADRRHFFVISRGSAFESFAILQILANQYKVDMKAVSSLKDLIETIARMLFGLTGNVSLKS